MSEQPISPDPLAPPEIGNRLARAREAASMSIDQVAAKLLVSASQIQAIEAGRLPPSYSAGYYERTVRKYADYLGIEVDQTALPAAAAAIGQAHAAHQDGTPAARLAGFTPQRVGIGGRIDRPTIESNWNVKAWIAGVVVLVLVIAGFVFRDKLLDPSPPTSVSGHEQPPVAPSAPSPAAATAPSPAAAVPAGATVSSSTPAGMVAVNGTNGQPNRSVGASSSSDTSTSPTEGERATPPAPEAGAPASATSRSAVATASGAATPADSGNLIKVTFDAPCWVQLVKSDGTRSEKIFQPDQALEFPADAMASLVIGNARSARMAIDGRDINLSQFMKGDVVRMSDASLQTLLH